MKFAASMRTGIFASIAFLVISFVGEVKMLKFNDTTVSITGKLKKKNRLHADEINDGQSGTQTIPVVPGEAEVAQKVFRKSKPDSVKKVIRVDFPLEEQVPRLVIGGAQKGGTSALIAILSTLKEFVDPDYTRCPGGTRNELHFFDKFVYGKDILKKEAFQQLNAEDPKWQKRLRNQALAGSTDNVTLALRKEYAQCWDFPKRDPKNFVSLEKTPIYMIDSALPAVIKAVAPWIKVLFVVREPVSRAYSAYKMNKERGEAKGVHRPPLEEIIEKEVGILKEKGSSDAPTLTEFASPDYILNLTAFEIPSITERASHRDIQADNKNKDHYLYRGMYAQLLSPWLEHFELGKDLLVLSSERMREDTLGGINKIQEFVGTKPTSIEEKVVNKDYHHRDGEPLDDTTNRYLQHFMKPYNDELFALMGKEWYTAEAGERWLCDVPGAVTPQ